MLVTSPGTPRQKVWEVAVVEISAGQIRAHRLRAHHLDERLPEGRLAEAAGACGLQNSPPGAWETAMFNRVRGCSLPQLHTALYQEKSLLQAWSFRGAPVVFPTGQSAVFLGALQALPGEQPWIYTRGITAALDFLQLPFEQALQYTRQAAACLDACTVVSKEALDQALADRIEPWLPPGKRALWRAPSMYGRPDRQTVGGAAVSFLLRPCAFLHLVVFGERQGVSPTFTSFKNWVGHAPIAMPGAARRLVCGFLHCYGPATVDSFMNWLGCCKQQARRLWSEAETEMRPVQVGGRRRFALAQDMESLTAPVQEGERLLLLGPHDPYLDIRDRDVLLPGAGLQRRVWKTMANPGAVLKGGRVVGIWNVRTQHRGLEVRMELFEALPTAQRRALDALAEEYAVFRGTALARCTVDE